MATNVIGPREIMDDKKADFIVPTADSDALAEVIMKIFDNYELTYKMRI